MSDFIPVPPTNADGAAAQTTVETTALVDTETAAGVKGEVELAPAKDSAQMTLDDSATTGDKKKKKKQNNIDATAALVVGAGVDFVEKHAAVSVDAKLESSENETEQPTKRVTDLSPTKNTKGPESNTSPQTTFPLDVDTSSAVLSIVEVDDSVDDGDASNMIAKVLELRKKLGEYEAKAKVSIERNQKLQKDKKIFRCGLTKLVAESAISSVIEFVQPEGDLLRSFLFFVAEHQQDNEMPLAWLLAHGDRPWDESLCERAAQEGNLEMLQLLKTNAAPWNHLLVGVAAASSGHVEVLDWSKANGCLFDQAYHETIAAAAASAGHVAVLEWASTNGCLFDEAYFGIVVDAAARTGHVAVLEWSSVNGCDFDEMIMEGEGYYLSTLCSVHAEDFGHLSVVKWATGMGFEHWDDYDVTVAAAAHGHLHILEWNRNLSDPFEWDHDIFYAAAGGGQLHVLQWLFKNSPDPYPWDEVLCNAAAFGGHLHVLQWLRSGPNPCPWDSDVCKNAAIQNSLELLQWARTNACPWDEETCSTAARFGHLELLQWARNVPEPCPWNAATCSTAAQNGHLKVLKWAIDHGCPHSTDHERRIAHL